jgi:hypothetical protein
MAPQGRRAIATQRTGVTPVGLSSVAKIACRTLYDSFSTAFSFFWAHSGSTEQTNSSRATSSSWPSFLQ